jgi:predicted metalloprotease
MIDMLTRLSPISADTFMLLVLIGLIAFVAVPIGVTFFLKRERRQRRKLVDSPRKIALATEEEVARECDHLRSRSRARETAEGVIVSRCKKCGAAMRREGPGE